MKLSDFRNTNSGEVVYAPFPVEVRVTNIDDILRCALDIGVKEIEMSQEDMKILVTFVTVNFPSTIDWVNKNPKDIWIEKFWGIKFTHI